MKFVVLESPYAGDVERNRRYANECIRDSIYRGEAPLASHLLYTEALNDDDPYERRLGIEAGLEIGKFAVMTVVYIDYGISRGMQYGIDRAEKEQRLVEYRCLYDK